jgi:hypothetical protein
VCLKPVHEELNRSLVGGREWVCRVTRAVVVGQGRVRVHKDRRFGVSTIKQVLRGQAYCSLKKNCWEEEDDFEMFW